MGIDVFLGPVVEVLVPKLWDWWCHGTRMLPAEDVVVVVEVPSTTTGKAWYVNILTTK